MRRAVVLAAVVLGVLVPSASAETALNVIPHGQTEPGVDWASVPGILPADTQARMYDRLTPLFRAVGPAQLRPSTDGTGYFKSAALLRRDDPSFVTSETIRGAAPHVGGVSATIKRDRYGVAHVYSATDAGVVFGAGYVMGEDRNVLIDQARFNGVAALEDLPGVPAINLILGLYDYRPSARVVREVTAAQTRAIRASGAGGRRLLRDIDVYLAGLNRWYGEHKPASPRLTRTDIYALNAVKGQFLGQGGGEEVGNGEFLDALRQKLGAHRGDEAFEDLRGRDDPETPTTTSRRFPWQTHVSVAHPRGLVRLRNGSFVSSAPVLPGASAASAARAAAATGADEHLASNILIASGKRSATGAPLFVGGPQIGYNYPGLTLEMGLYGPHIRVRGATSAPFPGYMLIGRGTGFAWTLTSAGADIIDTYAERLCGGSRTRYRYKGRCRSMQSVDAGTISKGGRTVAVRFRRTVHGPVVGYARVRGSNRLVALTQRRSSRDRDTVDELFFQRLTYGKVRSARDFIAAAAQTPQTFNSFYASRTQAAFFTSGRLPMRPAGVNPDLPVDGSGRYEWRGYLPASRHPQVVNPSSGYIVNWNNKPARDFPSSDERWGEHSLQRVQLLEDELARRPKQTLASVLAAANAAATEDVRIVELWPTLRRALSHARAPSARAREMVRLLDRWDAAGGSRRDANRDGRIDDPGAAILDAAWGGISDAALCDRLGRALCEQFAGRKSRFDAPPGGQYSGWHQELWKDLRAQLGDTVRGRFHLEYCGAGSLRRCVRELWRSIALAGRALSVQQGPDPAAWRAPEAREQITFSPVPLTTMQYTNRPTGIHQVMTFGP